jgi:hypothetical protein
MNKNNLAKLLNDTEYPLRISKDLRKQAKESGLVIIYGASDDLMEFDGAIYDEIGVYDGGTVYIHPEGILPDEEDLEEKDEDELENWSRNKIKSRPIEAIWGENGMSWQYKTEIPHVTFDIMEDDNIYCRGIIIDINALKQIKIIENLKKF